ncbi:ribosomal protein S18-alanine N-acetyltransferase [Oryzisolibacter sp. LB2S]|uniref:ribosomal protein S18-alanine N-acetyltransferase n=1 Tax=Alicycliphilus soli TaxID=3228789 RepID=UPI00345AB05F
MSAMPQSPDATEVRFEPLTPDGLDALMAIEEIAYSHPWTRGNFIDALAAGYQVQLLMAGEQLLGYFVAMPGVQEAHLLNITVAPAFQRQGWAHVMLDALALWARGQGALSLWLEVRVSNTRARQIYERHGYRSVGLRKQYYPGTDGRREDAVVMSLPL